MSYRNFACYQLNALTSNEARWAMLVVLALIIVPLTGCEGPATNEPADSDAEAKVSQDDADKPAVLAADSSTSPSPALQSSAANAKQAADSSFDRTPDGVCQRFVAMLQEGNSIAAQNLLTRVSRALITDAGLKLEPLGGPHATYKMADLRYATNEQKLAQVDCKISETIDGELVETNVTWLVRRFDKAWRISGVILETEPGKGLDLLSFENKVDVAKIQSLASEAVINEGPTGEPAVRQAKSKAPDIK